MGKIVNIQQVKKKENIEFKPAVLILKIRINT